MLVHISSPSRVEVTWCSNKMSAPLVDLNDGFKMPFFGLGTYKLKGQEGIEAMKYAIEVGYRHIDTAFLYETEKEVGEAVRAKIKDGTIKREDIFITTKLRMTSHRENEVVPACRDSLKNLGLDYVDLFLIHSPVSLIKTDDFTSSDIDYVETWRGMEECKRLGLARSIGVSNFNSEQISRLISSSSIKPVNNQVEVNLNMNQKRLIEFCKGHDIVVTGYSPLGKPGSRPNFDNFWSHPKVQELSTKYAKNPSQIALRFIYQMGAAPLPKSATNSRIKQNIEIFDFSLTPEEMNALQSLGNGNRVVPMDKYKSAKYFPFNIPF